MTRFGRRAFPVSLPALPAWIAVWVAAVACLTLIELLPTPPNDLWWHLRVGQLISSTWRVPTTNLYAWSVPSDTGFVYASWLGDLMLYAVFQPGGVTALAHLRTLLAGGLLLVVALETRRRLGSWHLGGGAVLLAGLLLLANVTVRPQIWAWVPFGLLAMLLDRYRAGILAPGWLTALPVLMVFWVNVHGSFALGLLLIACHLGGGIWERLRFGHSTTGPAVTNFAQPWRRTLWLGVAALATAVATTANPRGWSVFAYLTDVATNTSVRGFVREWQPPTPSEPVFFVFFATLILLIVSAIVSRPLPSPTDTLVVVAFAGLALTASRFIPWYGILVAPILVEALARLRPGLTARPRTPRRYVDVVASAAIVMFAVPLAIVLSRPATLIRTPMAATEYLNRQFTPLFTNDLLGHWGGAFSTGGEQWTGAHIFSEVGYGSYLIWAAPSHPPFIDPRFELFPETIWSDYLTLSAGRDVEALLDRYHIDVVFLSRELQAALSTALATMPAWRLTYQDTEAEIWSRRGAE